MNNKRNYDDVVIDDLWTDDADLYDDEALGPLSEEDIKVILDVFFNNEHGIGEGEEYEIKMLGHARLGLEGKFFAVKMTNSNPISLDWLSRDLDALEDKYGISYDREGNDEGFYGENYLFYKVVTPVEESVNEDYEEVEPNKELADKAWMLNLIISNMNNEEAYYGGWLYIWPDGESKEECLWDFGDEESYKELEDTFIRKYKAYHEDGLYGKYLTQEIIDAAHEWDNKLGLSPIEVL